MFSQIAVLLSRFTGRDVKPPRDGERREAAFRRMRDAEEFLDLLENLSVPGRELKVVGDSAYVVRWRS